MIWRHWYFLKYGQKGLKMAKRLKTSTSLKRRSAAVRKKFCRNNTKIFLQMGERKSMISYTSQRLEESASEISIDRCWRQIYNSLQHARIGRADRGDSNDPEHISLHNFWQLARIGGASWGDIYRCRLWLAAETLLLWQQNSWFWCLQGWMG